MFRPTRAADESELYWQDALRAHTLTGLLTPLALVALLAISVCGVTLDDAASQGAADAGQVGPAWSLALLIAGYVVPLVIVVTLLIVGAVGWLIDRSG